MDSQTTEDLYSRAYEFAEIAYSGSIRKNSEPLLEHAKRIVEILKSISITDPKILSAAILHDVLKTKAVNYDELLENFGIDIATIVTNLTEISNSQMPAGSNKNIDELHKLFMHLVKDIRVLIIRLADRLDNIKNSRAHTQSDQEWIAKNAIYLYSPIAKSAGLNFLANSLENEAFRILHPSDYKILKLKFDELLETNKSDLENTVDKIKDFLDLNNINNKVSYRTKHLYSCYKKLIKYTKSQKALDVYDLDSLYDILAIRIIVDTNEECYKVLTYLMENFDVVYNEFDDYIANPKENGYQTLQIPIILGKLKCEVQIRTFKMHEDNEYGSSAHYSYKTNSKTKDAYWIKNLIAAKDNIQKNIAPESSLKLFEDEIFVFTPMHEVISLPKGSCIVDFAYAIHTEIGNTCESGIVNGKMCKLDTKLNSGDTVAINTKKGKKPSAGWLEFVKTHEAKRQINKMLGL